MENSQESMVEHWTQEAAKEKPFLQVWKRIFAVSCVFAVLLDPFFLYIPVVNEDMKCLRLENKLMKAAIFLCSITDLLYIVNIVFQIYIEDKAKNFWVMGKSYCQSLIPIDILAILPIPQVLGALWYFFSIQREIDCWQYACRSVKRCKPNAFDCDDHAFRNITLPSNLCPVNPRKVTLFDFGIFIDAVQSGMLRSTDFPQKFLHCFSWGLRNLSSFGQNLQTSTYAWEDLFAIFISIGGMLLFLIYLNGILQTYMQLETTRSKQQRKLMKMERKRGPEIASWLHNNGILLNMKKMIMTCVLHELEVNQDVNVENILSILPLECLKFIKRHLCLNTLKRVPVLQAMDEQVLTAVCDSHLKLVIYSENSYIIRESEPIDRMLFITQGIARTYTTSNDGSGFSRTVS
ncbi:putative cGMP-dependent kinase [Rosa chinensis]|uniref:Putative cGMP-dependent kinase n=1 Tax=Rosa chinensis TaxID=74649 RepID=A0A2P6SP79_ROSCH|nr:putative cGMP-dependent kinase [Rosa chinensis]